MPIGKKIHAPLSAYYSWVSSIIKRKVISVFHNPDGITSVGKWCLSLFIRQTMYLLLPCSTGSRTGNSESLNCYNEQFQVERSALKEVEHYPRDWNEEKPIFIN